MREKIQLKSSIIVKLDVKINALKSWEQSRQGYITIENKLAATFTVIDGWIVNYVLSAPNIGFKDAMPIELVGAFKLHGFNLPLIPIEEGDIGNTFNIQKTKIPNNEVIFSVEKELPCIIDIYQESPIKNYKLATISIADIKLAELVISDKTIIDITFTEYMFDYIPKEAVTILENNGYILGLGVPH